MTTILIIVLFILQLLSFYFLIILNTKLAKFKDLEKKQERLMREMDDSISLYLTEMKDENNRLISELQVVEKPQPRLKEQVKQTNEQETKQVVVELSSAKVDLPDYEVEPRVFIPKNIVANAYSRQQQVAKHTANQVSEVTTVDTAIEEKPKERTIEDRVVQLSKQGNTIEEIAKKLQKGKTEIELLLKFHS